MRHHQLPNQRQLLWHRRRSRRLDDILRGDQQCRRLLHALLPLGARGLRRLGVVARGRWDDVGHHLRANQRVEWHRRREGRRCMPGGIRGGGGV